MAMTATLMCPACDTSSVPHTIDGVTMSVCPGCGGIWFGNMQLKKAVAEGAKALDELMGFEPVGSHAERKRTSFSCPEDKIPLHRNELGGFPDISINTCYQCGGIFMEAETLDKLDDDSHHLTESEKSGISPEAQAAGAELDQLTEADHQRAVAMRQLLKQREDFLFGRWGTYWHETHQ